MSRLLRPRRTRRLLFALFIGRPAARLVFSAGSPPPAIADGRRGCFFERNCCVCCWTIGGSPGRCHLYVLLLSALSLLASPAGSARSQVQDRRARVVPCRRRRELIRRCLDFISRCCRKLFLCQLPPFGDIPCSSVDPGQVVAYVWLLDRFGWWFLDCFGWLLLLT